eukprot:gene3423-3914_t
MPPLNGTDYMVIRGPSTVDPDIYKATTLAILFIAIVALFLVEICQRKYLKRFKMCQYCYKETLHTSERSEADKKISIQSASCVSSNKSDASKKSRLSAGDVAAKEVQLDILNPGPVETSHNPPFPLDSSYRGDSSPNSRRSKISKEQLSEDISASSSLLPSAESNETKSQTRRKSSQTIFHANNLEKARKRRSAVCSSMPNGQDLPSTSKNPDQIFENSLKQEEDKMDGSGISRKQSYVPELQINGESYDHDNESHPNIPQAQQIDEDATDDGQLRCVVIYDEVKSVLKLQSVFVHATMGPGVPGFFVEVTLMPTRKNSTKSKVYLTAEREVSLAINEVFDLRCTNEDIQTGSLFIAVRPMFSDLILYAEAKLLELSLSNNKEVLLGGNLKGLPLHLSS